MANYKVVEIDALESKLTAIGNAIRTKTGDTELLTLEGMATSINGIKNADDYLADVIDKRVVELVNDKITGRLASLLQNGNKNLVTVDLPNLTELGESVFGNCSNLTTVNLPALKKMNASSFSGTSSLKKIYLPELVEITGYGYSFNNSSIEKAVFPKLTTKIQGYDFTSCRYLTTLVLGANTVVPLTATNAFNSNTPIAKGTGYIYVPRAQLEAYKAATNWSTLASQFRAIEDYPGIMEV